MSILERAAIVSPNLRQTVHGARTGRRAGARRGGHRSWTPQTPAGAPARPLPTVLPGGGLGRRGGRPGGDRPAGGPQRQTAGGRITALHLTGGPRVLAYGYTDGNLTEVTSSSGRPLRLAYDDRGRITSWIDTNGSRYEYTYDDQDRCIAEGGADGHLALTLTYDEHDPATGERVTAVTTADGHTRRYLIDERCRAVAEIDPLGTVPRYQYDSAGRVLSRTDALGATSLQEYDEAGRITRSIRPDGRIAGRPSTTNWACPQE
ncbi:RHS repeat domain-containing protein [Streptomyces sp. NRRL F-4428]|uniref:RHS repeat domain-containing protein n=1 Tax=Streptomyces sp. NRRL F-4428 TaxID=1609137 RepID=UPI00131E41EC|nr:RHS repeat domain-containing protein [Streptomyces sp. NRRL F-4428]